ncbi:MAG: phosphoglycerate dehydrogenase [Gammaproteobacteria bacterium]
MSFKILTLNNIAIAGLRRLPRDRYEVASEIGHPDAIMVRSADMHSMGIADSVKAIARAGAGVNNIPLEAMTRRGIPVFNAPGANANAVKELVIAGLLLGARNICQGWNYVRELDGDDASVRKLVEAGKKKYAGFELPGRTLGVVGLGAIGGEVANAALSLGMKAIGFDPQLTVQRAWQLSSGIKQATTLDHLFSQSSFVTLHVPLNDATRNLVNAERLALMKPGGILLNFARGGIVDDDAVLQALDSGHLAAYVSDFPNNKIRNHPRVTALPHLGASTGEAEENCAAMVADNLREFLENGNIRHSVNFPEAVMPRTEGQRITISNLNVPNMVGQISTRLAEAGVNIVDLLNKSRGEIAYTLVDVEGEAPEATLQQVAGIKGVLNMRVI